MSVSAIAKVYELGLPVEQLAIMLVAVDIAGMGNPLEEQVIDLVADITNLPVDLICKTIVANGQLFDCYGGYNHAPFSTYEHQRVSKELRKKILRKQHGKCAVCGVDQWRYGDTFDAHRILPGREGGEYCEENVILLCKRCHKNADDLASGRKTRLRDSRLQRKIEDRVGGALKKARGAKEPVDE